MNSSTPPLIANASTGTPKKVNKNPPATRKNNVTPNATATARERMARLRTASSSAVSPTNMGATPSGSTTTNSVTKARRPNCSRPSSNTKDFYASGDNKGNQVKTRHRCRVKTGHKSAAFVQFCSISRRVRRKPGPQKHWFFSHLSLFDNQWTVQGLSGTPFRSEERRVGK